MTLASHIIQILHKLEVGSLDFDLLKKKIERILQRQLEANQFISLDEKIEDRSDPQSEYHHQTVNQKIEQFGVARATFYRKRAKYENQGIEDLIDPSTNQLINNRKKNVSYTKDYNKLSEGKERDVEQ